MLIIIISLLKEKKQLNLKPTIKMSTQFCIRSISDRFSATESREVSLIGNVCNFPVNSNSIDKSHILNIHKYLMTKNDIK